MRILQWSQPIAYQRDTRIQLISKWYSIYVIVLHFKFIFIAETTISLYKIPVAIKPCKIIIINYEPVCIIKHLAHRDDMSCLNQWCLCSVYRLYIPIIVYAVRANYKILSGCVTGTRKTHGTTFTNKTMNLIWRDSSITSKEITTKPSAYFMTSSVSILMMKRS